MAKNKGRIMVKELAHECLLLTKDEIGKACGLSKRIGKKLHPVEQEITKQIKRERIYGEYLIKQYETINLS